jgi:hypothetical protein
MGSAWKNIALILIVGMWIVPYVNASSVSKEALLSFFLSFYPT